MNKHENVQWRWKTVLRKYDRDIDLYRSAFGKEAGEIMFFAEALLISERTIEGNLLMTLGADQVIKGFSAGGTTLFNNANAFIGVGDSATAPAIGQTDLQASVNKLRQAMDATYPTHANGTNVIVYSATFGTGAANFAWNEWGVFNAGPTGGIMLNRVVASLGTKTSAASWQLQGTLTLS
jgi:hypothetical protein